MIDVIERFKSGEREQHLRELWGKTAEELKKLTDKPTDELSSDECERLAALNEKETAILREMRRLGADPYDPHWQERTEGRIARPDGPCGDPEDLRDPDHPWHRSLRTASTFVGERGETWEEWKPTPVRDEDNLDDGGFRSFRDFLAAYAGQHYKRREDRRINDCVERAATLQDIAGAAGALVPERFVNEVLRTAYDAAPWLAMRRIFRLSDTRDVSIPRLQDQDRSSEEIAGVALTRVGEGVAATEDTILVNRLKMEMQKASRLLLVSNSLLGASAIGMGGFIRQLAADLVRMRQEIDFFTGSGAGEPLGILNASDKTTVSTSTGAGNLLIDDIAGMIAVAEGSNLTWLAHPTVIKALAKLRISTSAGETVLWQPNVAGGAPQTLYNHGFYFTRAAKVLDTVGDLWLTNLSEYVYLFAGFVIDISEHYKFANDQTAFRLKLLDNGQPSRGATGTDLQSQTTSNFVNLATRT